MEPALVRVLSPGHGAALGKALLVAEALVDFPGHGAWSQPAGPGADAPPRGVSHSADLAEGVIYPGEKLQAEYGSK